MATLLIIICIFLIVLGYYLYNNSCRGEFEETLGIVLQIIGGVVGILTAFIFLWCLFSMLGTSVIDDKIELYTQENEVINNDMKLMVSEYMKWESDTYEKFANADATVIVNLYPELKSNELIMKQMDIYLQNKEQIKALNTQLIEIEVYKFWIYFG